MSTELLPATHSVSPADKWLGQGFRMPLRPNDGRLEWIGSMDLVRQSLETILDTEPGERIMMPTFGCGLRRYLMAPNTVSTRAAIEKDVENALTTWEPRVRVIEVSVIPGEQPTLIWIGISYVHIADLRSDNLVYPFYLQ